MSSIKDLIEARRWISDYMRGRVCVPWSPVRVSVDRLGEYQRQQGASVIARIGEVVGMVLDVRAGEDGLVGVEMAIPAASSGHGEIRGTCSPSLVRLLSRRLDSRQTEE